MSKTVKQHIDDGDYTADDKGRPVVHTRKGDPVSIITTKFFFPIEGYGHQPILGIYEDGGVECWYENGHYVDEGDDIESSTDLMPPASAVPAPPTPRPEWLQPDYTVSQETLTTFEAAFNTIMNYVSWSDTRNKDAWRDVCCDLCIMISELQSRLK